MLRGLAATLMTWIVMTAAWAYSEQQNHTSPLKGAWRVTEVLEHPLGATTSPFPGLYIFTERHFSMIAVMGTKPRPRYESDAKATDAEKLATFDPLIARSGTYRVEGNRFVAENVVAKNEFVMGRTSSAEFTIDGDTMLWKGPRLTLRFKRME